MIWLGARTHRLKDAVKDCLSTEEGGNSKHNLTKGNKEGKLRSEKVNLMEETWKEATEKTVAWVRVTPLGRVHLIMIELQPKRDRAR